MTDTMPIKSETRALARILEFHRIDVVLDVGAQDGGYGLRLRRGGYHGWIVSFELVPDMRRVLRAAALGDDRWRVSPPVALGDHEGTLTTRPAVETAADDDDVIPLTRLDQIFDRHVSPHDRVFLRLGSQGSDHAVLAGATKVLPRIRGIAIELALVPVYPGEPDYLTAIANLAGFGFTPVLLSPGYFNRRTARQLTIDAVFVRLNEG